MLVHLGAQEGSQTIMDHHPLDNNYTMKLHFASQRFEAN